MKTISKILRDADPLRDDRGLSPEEITAMRRRIVVAARATYRVTRVWLRPLAVGATIALTIVCGIATGRHLAVREPNLPTAASSNSAGANVKTRQLQFATPGGTRIIWVFDPEFTLKESLP